MCVLFISELWEKPKIIKVCNFNISQCDKPIRRFIFTGDSNEQNSILKTKLKFSWIISISSLSCMIYDCYHSFQRTKSYKLDIVGEF